MNDPIRYRPALDDGSREPWMKQSELGGYVEHSDYKELYDKYQQLESINRSFADNLLRLGNECREMDREIKRLRSI